MAQCPVRAPFLGEFHGGPVQVALELLELCLQPRKESERIGRRAGKAYEDAVIIHAPYLARAFLDNRVSQRHLPVAGNNRLIASFDQQDCSPMKYSVV